MGRNIRAFVIQPVARLLVVGVASGCVSGRQAPLPADASVFVSRLPARPYREVAYVEATGSVLATRTQLLRRLQAQCTRLGGDALVQVRFDFVFWWPHAGAVVIVYQPEGKP